MSHQSVNQTQQQTATTHPFSTGEILQRKCASCGQHTITGDVCPECDQQESLIQRSPNGAAASSTAPPDPSLSPNSSFNHDISQVPVRQRQPLIHAKLTVGEPGDRYEQKADRVADQIIQKPDLMVMAGAQPIPPLVIQQLRSGAIATPVIQRRVLIGAEVMDEDAIDDFIQLIREGTLIVNNRHHREVLINHPQTTARLLREMHRSEVDNSFPDQTALMARLAQDVIAEIPTEEERRQLVVISELARLPHNAHRRWQALNSGQRGAVLWEMGRNYGSDFVQQFRQYVDAGRFEDSVNLTNRYRMTQAGRQIPLTAYYRLATEEGFKFAGAGYRVGLLNEHELWVHPSGRRIEFIPDTESREQSSEVTEEIGEQPEEEPLREEETDELTETWLPLIDRIELALHHGRPVTIESNEGQEFRITGLLPASPDASATGEYHFQLSHNDSIEVRYVDYMRLHFVPESVRFP